MAETTKTNTTDNGSTVADSDGVTNSASSTSASDSLLKVFGYYTGPKDIFGSEQPSRIHLADFERMEKEKKPDDKVSKPYATSTSVISVNHGGKQMPSMKR